ncbi:hypothetical protein GH714_031490 [Hevea brasiliensis]|uniref:EF-hand domain-containing protein n=1 Tax=Hevea brasiliensis TaxID=3981 RepID=A0A6A6L4M5_HEVBR|nr:hypothetical protein GH714_031490 [Hevea brasiliensis]
MSPCTVPQNNYSKENELKEVFRHFDSDGDEKISALELRSYFGSIGEYMSYEEAQAVIEDLDSDGDKLLDFKDFLRLMKREANEEDADLKKAFEMFEMEKGSGRRDAALPTLSSNPKSRSRQCPTRGARVEEGPLPHDVLAWWIRPVRIEEETSISKLSVPTPQELLNQEPNASVTLRDRNHEGTGDHQ